MRHFYPHISSICDRDTDERLGRTGLSAGSYWNSVIKPETQVASTDQYTIRGSTSNQRLTVFIMLSLPYHPFSYSATCQRSSALSPPGTSLIECYWVRCSLEVGASHFLTCFVLPLPHALNSLSIWSTVGSLMTAGMWACITCVCALLVFYRAEGQSPCERPSVASGALWWRSDGERWEETH